MARAEAHADGRASAPRLWNGHLVFEFHDDDARVVALAGDFNGWAPDRLPLHRDASGLWTASIAALPPGRYRYKFLIDGTRWIADPSHSRRDSDPYGGFDSILTVS